MTQDESSVVLFTQRMMKLFTESLKKKKENPQSLYTLIQKSVKVQVLTFKNVDVLKCDAKAYCYTPA